MAAPTPLHIDRVGASDYVARNERGAEVRIGAKDVPGTFTPGELLQLALAACTLLSADRTLSAKLGDGFAARVDVSAEKEEAENRYQHMAVRLLADMEVLDEGARARLSARAAAVIERACTVGNTLGHDAGMPYDVSVEPAD